MAFAAPTAIVEQFLGRPSLRGVTSLLGAVGTQVGLGRCLRGAVVVLAIPVAGCQGQIGTATQGGPPGAGSGSTAGSGNVASSGAGGPVPCNMAASFAPPRLWRINDQQYGNVVRDVFGANITVPPDISASLSVGTEEPWREATLTISNMVAQNYMNSAHTTALSAVANLPALLSCATPDATCVQNFIKSKVARAFRRPVADTEVQDMLALYQLGAADGPSVGARVLLEYVLQAPSFLWRTELAGANPANPSAAPQPLGPFELAETLGFLFVDSAPDDGLWAKATDGSLTNPQVLSSEVDRLMALPATKANMANKVGTWLSVHRIDSTVKDPAVFPEFTPSVKTALTQSGQMFLQDVVLGGTLKDLITSPKIYLNQELAALYSVSGVMGPSLVPVSVTLPERSGGILTQPAMLTATDAHPDRGDVVHRGLFIYSSMVCGSAVPGPPPNAAAVAASLPASATERDRANFRASRGDCSPCHSRFDPLGLLTERYDAIGRYRERDASGQLIDQSANLHVGSNVDGPANGIGDLITRLNSSRQFADCAAGNLVNIAVGRDVTADNSCALQSVRDQFAQNEAFVALFRAIATSPAFVMRDGNLQ